jgi:excisionase family DNA binding protein
MNETLLSIGPAAKRLGISVATLRVWADKGLISVVKLPGGYRRFQPEVIEAKKLELGFVELKPVGKAAPADSPLKDLIGIAASDEPEDVSSHVDDYLYGKLASSADVSQ